MQASIKWLKEYVDFNQTPEVLAEMLTMAGVPVEGIRYLGKEIENVVTGKIVDIDTHPNANKLSICSIDVGKEKLIIVTGATNVRVGQIVPVALVGAKLPNNIVIQPTELRGIMSYGMLCSAAELNIDAKLLAPEKREGIYILSEDTPIGLDVREVLGLNDTVLEFELTANKADCFSMIGLAREIAALTGGALKKPMLTLKEAAVNKAGSLAKVSIQETSLCARFAARVLQDVKVGPSPNWMQERLRSAGMRPINNVVDVTNYVMLEMGQPMHAYDYNLLSRHSIIVRRANPGEKLTTLDSIKRELSTDMLVIADEVQAIGIAGVMGGLATEVTNVTQNVLLEAAAFNSASVRRTSRSLGLRSEASGRFERGVDVANIVRALDRAAKLLEEMGACQVCPGIIDVYPEMLLPKQVSFTPKAVNAYLGTDISKEEMLDILRKLEFAIDSSSSEDKIVVNVPTWRGDVHGQADICEEIARIYGYNRIPSTLPKGEMLRGGQEYVQSIGDRIKTLLTGMGFNEIVSFSFTHPNVSDKLNIPKTDSLRKAIPIINPITDDFPILRTSLLGGVLETVARNLSRKNEDMKIYELGAVYLPHSLPLTTLPDEPLMLCGALLGRRQEVAWNHSKDVVDFYDAKGAVEEILESLGITGYEVIAGTHYSLHPGKTACFVKDDTVIASVGEVHPQVSDAFEIERKVYAFEIAIDKLAQEATLNAKYVPLPKYPSISRDLALVLPKEISAAEVMKVIKANAGPWMTDLRLFDVYTGAQVPEGCKSMAFSMMFRSMEKTLTDNEVEVFHKNIIVSLEETFKAELRK